MSHSAETIHKTANVLIHKLSRVCLTIQEDLKHVMHENEIYSTLDLMDIEKYAQEKEKLDILLYDVPIEYRDCLSDNMLNAMYKKMQAKEIELGDIGKQLDNRDLFKYNKLRTMIGIDSLVD